MSEMLMSDSFLKKRLEEEGPQTQKELDLDREREDEIFREEVVSPYAEEA